MVSITLSVPPEMKKHMEAFPDINWSAVARHAIKKKLTLLQMFEEFTKDSELTEEDAIQMGREIKKKAHQRFRDEFGR